MKKYLPFCGSGKILFLVCFEELCNTTIVPSFPYLIKRYVLVAVITILAVIYRVATMFSFSLRLRALGSASDFPEKPQGKYVVERIGRSDWLLLRFLRINMDSITFYKVVRSIHEEMMNNI